LLLEPSTERFVDRVGPPPALLVLGVCEAQGQPSKQFKVVSAGLGQCLAL